MSAGSLWKSSATGTDPVSIISGKIANTRAVLLEWSKKRFGKIREEIEKVRGQLAFSFDVHGRDSISTDRVTLETILNDLLRQEQVFWKQRAKNFWLSDGDMNTKFFHQCASNRRKKNLIKGLFNENGVWCTTDEELEDIVLRYYGQLFTSSQPSNLANIMSLVPKVVTEDMNADLVKDITMDEVHLALKQMHPSKAPGPDGFSPCFYQYFWPLVGNDVVEAVRCFLGSDEKIKSLNCTHVALIPKVKLPQSMNQLRPISLCNVLYKIGSKVLANRLKPLLTQFISPFQSAFVPGRLISDNSLIAFEIAHFLKKRRDGKVGFGALKLDMSKAYDRVEWSFLEAVLVHMGFSSTWIMWIMRCVRSVSYSFILNGEPRGVIYPSRVVRQGDAISPYLFLLCAEVLSRMISHAEDRGTLQGVKVCRAAPSISHLFFADDSLVFFKAEEGACIVLKEILMNYEVASGQKVNFEKSSVCFSRNVPLSKQLAMAALINVTWVKKHEMYLGLPMDISYSKVDAFSFLKEKVRKKLQGWREKTLSAAGKEVLLKSVVQSIPTYVISCFELPKQLCHDIHQFMARFWWGAKGGERKIHWVAWEKLCIPKMEGGLGFKNLPSFNLSLLAKQGWRLLMNPDSLIARFFKARYFPNDSFMDAPFRSGMSYIWRSILAGREVLSKGLRYQIGDGSTVSLWSDPWLPLPYSFKPFSCPMDGTELWKVRDLIDEDSTEWVSLVVEELFSTPLRQNTQERSSM